MNGVGVWILLLLGTSNKIPYCWTQMRFLCWEPRIYKLVLLIWNCDAQWHIQFLYRRVYKSDAMCRHICYGFEFELAGFRCPCCLVCIIVPCVIVIWICAIPIQSLVCNNRGLFFDTLLKVPFCMQSQQKLRNRNFKTHI